jgi:Xaa-Pro aminopeptidase
MTPAALLVLALGAPILEPPEVGPALLGARREKLVAALPAGSIAVLRASLDRDDRDPYRPDSDFWYLTGFREPDAVAVLRPSAPAGERYLVFVRPRDFAEEQWTGWRLGPEGAQRTWGADAAYPVGDFFSKLPDLLRGATVLHVSDGGDLPFREKLLAAFREANRDAAAERSQAELGPVVHQMRLVKDTVELELLKRAAMLSVEAHKAALKAVAPGRYEYALKAPMVETCLAGGAARMAYPPIVGSGPNSVILHYDRDDRQMRAGEMIVNDTACEYGMYAADVTRSYPVSGRFSPEQKAVYEIVLTAQKAGFAKVKPGSSLAEVYSATVEVIAEGLLRLGILSGTREAVVASREFKKFYPHGSSHWLGLEVHDVGSYGFDPGVTRQERYFTARAPLEPGMVLTVEPGIYIPEGSTPDTKWWNIGVRIEDDAVVTKEGMDCLSCGAPRELAEVEAALKGRR